MTNNVVHNNFRLSIVVFAVLFWGTTAANEYPIVPGGHPRVFITPADISILKNKRLNPEFSGLWNEIKVLSNTHFLSAALVFVVDQDTVKGNWAINEALTALHNKSGTSDAINKSSNIMNRAACVYDWCYDLLSSDQKAYFIVEFERLAATEAPGYPADYNPYSVIVGHIAESNVQLSQLLAGCAIYDENQIMWDAAITLHWDKFIPARNNLYSMHMYWQGDSYAGRFINDCYNAWFYKKLEAGNVYVSDMQYIPFGILYNTRPDGRQFKRGDRYDEKGNAGKKGPIFRTMAMYWENPYLTTLGDDPWYAYYASSNDGAHDMEKVFEFILRPTGLTGAPISDLPLTKYFPDPMGEMIARTGWDWLNEESDDAIVTMEIGGCDFKGHTNPGHFGGFQIYYKGALAVSSGSYQNKTAHDNNYHEKSQAHNVLLILDPNENTYYGTDHTYTAKDGGQICQPFGGTYESKPVDYEDLLARFRKCQIIAHQFGPDTYSPEYSYISGDLTPAYSNQPVSKVSFVKRSMVTLNHFSQDYPASLIIYDVVIASDATFKKTWQLHTIEEPIIENNSVTIRRTAAHYPQGPSGGIGNYSGKLILNSLLPLDADLQKIGGVGYDCWNIFENQNYPPNPQGSNYDYENGMWRVEISPGAGRYIDIFLNVLTVMDGETSIGPEVEAIDTGILSGVKVLDQIVYFSKTGLTLSDPLTFTVEKMEIAKVLVCDLEPGNWAVMGDGNQIYTEEATVDGKCIYFSVPSGQYSLARTSTSIITENRKNDKYQQFKVFPNPFNADTKISFRVKKLATVSLEIYDIAGRKIRNLVHDNLTPNEYRFTWNGDDHYNIPLSSGIYFCRLKIGNSLYSRKVLLIK